MCRVPYIKLNILSLRLHKNVIYVKINIYNLPTPPITINGGMQEF